MAGDWAATLDGWVMRVGEMLIPVVEHEAVVAGSASWVVAGNAADAITKELK